MKPFLACDVDFNKAKYPLMLFPKIDGVRGLNVDGKLVGRSGKGFANKLNSEFFSSSKFNGFDGEMVVDRVTGSGICNETSSALTTIDGDIPTRWCLFDYVIEGYNDREPYGVRYRQLTTIVLELIKEAPSLAERLWLIPYNAVSSKSEVEDYEMAFLEHGFEGLILRDPSGPYKFGRCTARESNYLRLKRFLDSEIMITHVIEGKENLNAATKSPNGYTERATHAENMVPNGKIGTICGYALKTETFGNKVVLTKGQEVEVSAGKMSHADRAYLFENQEKVIGKIAKFQFFPIGIKDKPRFPTFQGFRDPVDL